MIVVDTLRAFYKRHFIRIGLAMAVLFCLAATLLAQELDPQGGSLPPGIFQLLSLPALLLYLMLHTAAWTYDKFLNPWWEFLKSDQPKLFEDVLPKWEEVGSTDPAHTHNAIAYYRLKFHIRCIRTLFSWFPLLFLLVLLTYLVTLSLTLSPTPAPLL